MLVLLYDRVRVTGVLNTPVGRGVFDYSYNLYKEYYEARDVALLRACVPPDSSVIDVGANIGFFTTRFAQWVSGAGRVIALEPDVANMHRLQHNVQQTARAAVVTCIQSAVSDVVGEVRFILNPAHPGDHKLSTDTTAGVFVPVTTIDTLVRDCELSVSLIKIDVQGAEMRVLQGGEHTIETQRPAIYLELDDGGLRQFGSSALELLGWCVSRGYDVHTIQKGQISPRLTISHVMQVAKQNGYIDVLLIHAAH